MRTKIAVVFFTTVLFICCKHTSSTPVKTVSYAPNQADEVIAKTKWPETDLAQLSSGYSLYTTNCNKCHTLYKPEALDEAKWTKMVGKMGPKAKLGAADQQLILRYLLAKREVLMEKNPK